MSVACPPLLPLILSDALDAVSLFPGVYPDGLCWSVILSVYSHALFLSRVSPSVSPSVYLPCTRCVGPIGELNQEEERKLYGWMLRTNREMEGDWGALAARLGVYRSVRSVSMSDSTSVSGSVSVSSALVYGTREEEKTRIRKAVLQWKDWGKKRKQCRNRVSKVKKRRQNKEVDIIFEFLLNVYRQLAALNKVAVQFYASSSKSKALSILRLQIQLWQQNEESAGVFSRFILIRTFFLKMIKTRILLKECRQLIVKNLFRKWRKVFLNVVLCDGNVSNLYKLLFIKDKNPVAKKMQIKAFNALKKWFVNSFQINLDTSFETFCSLSNIKEFESSFVMSSEIKNAFLALFPGGSRAFLILQVLSWTKYSLGYNVFRSWKLWAARRKKFKLRWRNLFTRQIKFYSEIESRPLILLMNRKFAVCSFFVFRIM